MTFDPIAPWPLLIIGAVLLIGGCAALAVITPDRRWRWFVRAGAVLLLFTAMVRPGTPADDLTQEATSAVDVFILVDTTASMVAEDWEGGKPRLDGAKDDMLALVEQLPGARISMITFDSSAVVRVPLTTDHTAFGTAVETLGPEITLYSGGSSVTEAHGLLHDRLVKAQEQNPENARLVYYFGDGEQTAASAPASMSSVAGMIDGGAVFGYGTSHGGPMRETLSYYSQDLEAEYIRDYASGGNAISRIDEGHLRSIASDLGLDYSHRTAAVPFALVHTAPSFDPVLVETEIPGGITEYFWIPLLAVFAWIVVEALLGMNRIRTLIRLHSILRTAS